MKFIVSSSQLSKQLALVNGVISTNTVLPILEDFMFNITGKVLHISATDLETVMKVQLDIEGKDDVKVCIPHKIISEYLKNISDQPLTFNIDENYAIDITSDNGKYKIMGENPDNFPKEPIADDVSSFTMKSNCLVTAINKTLFAVSSDDLRPAMTGVCFELTKKSIQFVSTDAHKLVKYKRDDVKPGAETSFIVPRKPLNLLKNSLPDNEDELEISYTEKHLFVKHSKIEMVCRLIDARFPDYKVVIPADNPYKLVVNKADFQSALRRVNVFSNKSTNQVVLSINGSELQLVSQDVDFSFQGTERMSCQFDGGELQIAFNARFLIELLNAVDTSEINLELSTPTRAGLIKPAEQVEKEDLLILVMPLMINS
jgi:DNA polymerase III subunit beta